MFKVVVFDSQEALIKAVEKVKPGTLAFVLSDQLLYVRTNGGWKTVVVRRDLFVCKVTSYSLAAFKITGKIMLAVINTLYQFRWLHDRIIERYC